MRIKIASMLLILGIVLGCQQNVSDNIPEITKGMVKVSIFYPNGEGKTFDMDYYAQKHMPMAANLFGKSLKAMVIDEGLAGRTPELPPTYLAVGYFYFDTMSSCQSAMGAHSDKLKADVSNYTNIQPIIQISKVQTVQWLINGKEDFKHSWIDNFEFSINTQANTI